MGNVFDSEKIKKHIRDLNYKEPRYLISVFNDSKSYSFCLSIINKYDELVYIVLIKSSFDEKEIKKLKTEVDVLSNIFNAPIIQEEK